MTETIKEFIQDSYQLVSASSPTVPLHGSDMINGLRILNRLLRSYSGTGLMLTIAKTVAFTMGIGQNNVTFGSPSYVPTPDVPVGRLANMQNAWLELDGVTYPLVDESRNVFLASYKYDPQQGLPRFAIIYNETNLTRMRVYPSPSQVFNLFVYGKFELPSFTENDDTSQLPDYYIRFLQFALAKDLAFYKGRSQAWTPDLQNEYMEAKKDTESVSSVNLVVQTENESLLNGSWRVRAGV